jgi:cysteine desulfurase/selenocysteine lyase
MSSKTHQWRERFPIFQRHPELAYLDNAATSQRLDTVLETMHEFSLSENANVHRGVYQLSRRASDRYEEVRDKVAGFINAGSHENVGFTTGTTESINIVAKGFLAPRLHPGDNVIVSILEHHANFLPWQEVCQQKGAELRILELDEHGQLSIEALTSLLDDKTRMVALNHISNTLGSIQPIGAFAALCKSRKIPILIDAAQSAGWHGLDVAEISCDFLAFSGHKIFGPMGSGVLYACEQYRKAIAPLMVGGGMIREVGITQSSYREFPYNLEAGTPNVPGILGLGTAIDFLSELDPEAASQHVAALVKLLTKGLASLPEVSILPHFEPASGIVSFTVRDIHPHDVAGHLNRDQIAVRAGMHCTQPLLDHLRLEATVRVSFSLYNQEKEVNRLIQSLKRMIELWK